MISVLYNSGWSQLSIVVCEDGYRVVTNRLKTLGKVSDLDDLEGLEKEYKSVLNKYLTNRYLIKVKNQDLLDFDKFINSEKKKRDRLYENE